MKSRARFCTPIILAAMLAAQSMTAQQSQPTGGNQQPAAGQDEGSPNTTDSLQKATQNPVASLISVPLQNNTNFGIGPYDRAQNVLNIQPVIPVGISKDWNLIVRWITPIISQPAPGTANLEVYGIDEGTPAYLAAQTVQANASVNGFGDMHAHLLPFSSQAAQAHLGCRTDLRSAHGYEQSPRTRQVQHRPLDRRAHAARSLDSRCPDQQRLVGRGTLRPQRCEPDAVAVFRELQPEKRLVHHLATASLRQTGEASSGNVWTVPYGGGVGRIMKLGFQPINFSAQFYGNAEHPRGGSHWGVRGYRFVSVPQANLRRRNADGGKAKRDGRPEVPEEVTFFFGAGGVRARHRYPDAEY